MFGENTKGQSIVLCRYLCALRPPSQVVDVDNESDPYAIEKVARFVSLIPFENDLKNFEDLDDLYCTC